MSVPGVRGPHAVRFRFPPRLLHPPFLLLSSPSLIPLPLQYPQVRPPLFSIHQSEPESGTKKPLVCARCHSLRHYGRVKNPSADSLPPEFDFQATVAPRLASPCGAPSLLLLADASDFDGS